MRKTKAELLMQWTEHIKEVEANGYIIRHYCSEHGLKEKRYYKWRKRIREEKETISDFTKLTFPTEEEKVFAGFKIDIGNGISIIPEREFNEYEFLRAVKILQRV